jgi:hypothetical protein
MLHSVFQDDDHSYEIIEHIEIGGVQKGTHHHKRHQGSLQSIGTITHPSKLWVSPSIDAHPSQTAKT